MSFIYQVPQALNNQQAEAKFIVPGTSDTCKNAYSDYELTTPIESIHSDDNGLFAPVYLADKDYKVVVENDSALIATYETVTFTQSLTLDTNHNVKSILENLPAGFTVTLKDATEIAPYAPTGSISLKNPVTIKAENSGNCFFNGTFRVETGGVYRFEGLDMIMVTGLTCFNLDGGATVYIDNVCAKCPNDVSPNSPAYLNSSNANLFLRALNRNCLIDCSEMQQAKTLVQLQYQTKAFCSTGNNSGFYGWFRNSTQSTAVQSAWTVIVTMASAYIKNWKITGREANINGSNAPYSANINGILAQRMAHIRLLEDTTFVVGEDNLGVQDCRNAIEATVGSEIYISGTGASNFSVMNNKNGLKTLSHGTITYDDDTIEFSGNRNLKVPKTTGFTVI